MRLVVVVLGSCRWHQVRNYCQEHRVLDQEVLIGSKVRAFMSSSRTCTTSLYLGNVRNDMTIRDVGIFGVLKIRH